jgi:uroporphyrinogen decarboxylase
MTYELFSSPLADDKNVREVDTHPWPQADWFDYSRVIERCDNKSQYALAAGKTDLMGAGAFLQGMESFLIGLATDDPVTISILDHLTEFFLEFNRCVFESGKGKLDIAWYGDDYGTQQGLLISIPTWRKHIRPRLLKLVDLAKSYSLKVMLHSCGSIRELIPDLIDIGIDILDTLQPKAKGMEPQELKRLYGDKISFHGTISTAGVLLSGSSEDVKEEVIDRIRVMAKGGGFCLAPTHTIMPDTPIENVLTMYETALTTNLNRGIE